MGADAVFLQECGSSGGGLDVEAQTVEPADQGQRFLLVPVGDGGKDGAVVLQLHAGGLQRLVQGAGHGAVIADGLAGGLHFGGQIGVQTANFIEGEHRRFDVPALLFGGVDVEEALLLQAQTQNHVGGDVRKAVARGLAQEGNRAGGTGVDLDDGHVVLGIYDELHIEQADNADAQTQLFGVLQNDALDLVRDGEGGVDGDGVAGVNAGALHQFHDAGDEHVPAVADGVNLHFPTLNVFVHQNGLVLVDFHGAFQVAAQLALVRHDLHGAAAQHEAGTHQHGVADLVCRRETVLDFGDGSALGLGDVQLLQELFKGVPVFGSVDGLAAGADDLHAPVMEGLGQVDGGLTAQRRDHAVGLFKVDDVHHILGGQRLEVQLVGGGVVGGDGLGVIVDDDGLVARLFDGHDGVDGGVVKLHALTDADGACAQHHDLLFVRQPGDVPAGVGGVEVGDICAGVAGVHHAESREHIVFSAEIGHVRLGAFPEPAHIFIAEAHLLGVQKGFRLFGMEL